MAIGLDTIAKLAGDGAVVSAILWKLGAVTKAVDILSTTVNRLHTKVDSCIVDIAILKNHDKEEPHAKKAEHDEARP
jgi:hypothetical protein